MNKNIKMEHKTNPDEFYDKHDLDSPENKNWKNNVLKYWDKYIYTFIICYVYLSFVSIAKYIAKYSVTIIINKIFVYTTRV